jgi:hypothetical protein
MGGGMYRIKEQTNSFLYPLVIRRHMRKEEEIRSQHLRRD